MVDVACLMQIQNECQDSRFQDTGSAFRVLSCTSRHAGRGEAGKSPLPPTPSKSLCGSCQTTYCMDIILSVESLGVGLGGLDSMLYVVARSRPGGNIKHLHLS